MRNLRSEFPIFDANPELIYLDSAASAQKPQAVIDAMSAFMSTHYANVHRGVYGLSEEATKMYEDARESVRSFIGARSSKEIVFTKNATESLNLVAYSWALENLQEDEIIVVSEMEHHSNYLPWQMVAEKIGAKFVVWPFDLEKNCLEISFLENLIDVYGSRVSLIAVTQVSNVLGIVNPIREIVELARTVNARVVVDGCQAVSHLPVDVRELDVDFYAFSGHKLYGPTGIGVLYAKRDHLEYMHPFLRGGEMVLEVSEESSVWKELPWKFEAGTPPIVEAIGLRAAIDFVQGIGFDVIFEHEQRLTQELLDGMQSVSGIRILGAGDLEKRLGVVPFVVDGVHAHDVAGILDQDSICIRAGTHCAQPLLKRFGLASSARVSVGIYNNSRDIDQLMISLHHVRATIG